MRIATLFALLMGLCLVMGPLMTGKVARAADQDAGEDEEAEEYDDDAEEEINEEDVVVLTKDNFDSTISGNEFVLVEFYAPWCGHCKSLAPEYAAAATELKEMKKGVVLAKVDATEQTELAEKFGVDGYPTLKWFVNGTASEYGGGRDEESIIRWIKKSTGPVAETVETADALKEAEGKHNTLVLGYFKELSKDDADFAKWVDAAVHVDAVLLQTASADVAKAAGDMKPGSVVLILKQEGERKVLPYTGKMDGEELTKFVSIESLPLTLPFSSENTEKIFNSKISRHMILVAKAADLKPDAKIYKEFLEAAKQTRAAREFVFVTVDIDDEEGEPVIEFFGVKKDKVPMIISFQVEPIQHKWWYTGDITTAGIVKFSKAIADGSLEPEYQSEDIPSPDVVDNVKIVVGKTFKEVTADATKDVLLEVYAPWCGHCKELEPIYKQLAAKFKDIESVVIAKLDGTANEAKGLEVDGYPSIFLYRAEKDAEVVEYEGERELDAMVQWIKENAKSKFELAAEPPMDDAKDAPKEEKKDEL